MPNYDPPIVYQMYALFTIFVQQLFVNNKLFIRLKNQKKSYFNQKESWVWTDTSNHFT